MFQVKNNMRAPTPKVKTYTSKTSPFVIDGLRVNGRRKRLFFATETAANQELARIKIKQRREGETALSLSDTTRIAALEGERKLAVFGKSLNWAVEFALDHLEKSQQSVPISQVVQEYLDQKIRKGVSSVHITDLTNRFAKFCETHGATPSRTLTSHQVENWLYDLKLSPTSFNNYRSRLGALFGWGAKKEKGYFDHNLIEDIDKLKVVGEPVEIYTVDELTRLMNVAAPEILPMIAMGAFAGIRTAELLRVTWQDVDLSRGYLDIPASKSKTASRRNIKMEPNLFAWLSPNAGHKGPIFNGKVHSFLYQMRQTGKKAGLVKLPNNGLRHSFCSYHLAKYLDAARLALIMGHTTTKLIFSTYREVIKVPPEADRYFAIMPPTQPTNVISMQVA
jgi:integrase